MSKRHKIIISGGGTGGHIFPAIAIADALRKIDNTIEILFVGANGKMEMDYVPEAGYPIKGLWISGLQRRLTWQNLLFPVKVIHSLWTARRILKRFEPDLVIGFGGYASGPVLQVACRSGFKTAIQEQNAFPGATNRILARQVDLIFTAYPGMEKFFPEQKIKYFGNPVRNTLVESLLTVEEARAYFGLSPTKKTVLVFGGSLGAGILNKTMHDMKEQIQELPDIQFIWQTGKFYENEYKNCATAQLDNVKQLTFLERMDMAYTAADLVVCRAGALTIAELSVLGKPAILIPSPNVAEDHQTMNAKAMEIQSAAIWIAESSIEKLKREMIRLVNAPDELRTLSENAKKMAKPNAASNIAIEILKYIE